MGKQPHKKTRHCEGQSDEAIPIIAGEYVFFTFEPIYTKFLNCRDIKRHFRSKCDKRIDL